MKNELNEKWIKASVLGTVWAASEIVFGSFLHNLKVPFSGNILTAIGLVILISVSYTWHKKGLFWRAGLICAIMKTMSPSAVIFGPMIAILAEAFVLELSVRLLGRTWLGFAVGAIFAMSWNLFQKIVNFILFYGFNIVDLYTDLVHYAQKQLHIQFDVVWLPIIILLVAYSIFGLISAIIGIRTGQRIMSQTVSNYSETKAGGLKNHQPAQSSFHHSFAWLLADIIFMIGALAILNFTPLVVWSFSIIAIVSIWVFRYKRALRQLSKPKFWVFFVLITMLTAFAFSEMQPGTDSLAKGLLTGLQMNFRAVVIIIGFSVIGTELYNPRIRSFFLKTSIKQLPLALELSFESLPSVIAATPDFRTIMKNPVMAIASIIAQTEIRLKETRNKLNRNHKVFIVTGTVGQGKTTCIEKIARAMREKDISCSGIYTPRVMDDETIISYDIVDITSNTRECFLRQTGKVNQAKIGRYYISEQGLQHGINSLKTSLKSNSSLIIIDEVGKLELDGGGWSDCISDILNVGNSYLLLAVRDKFVESIVQKWNLNYLTFDLSQHDYHFLSNVISENILENRE